MVNQEFILASYLVGILEATWSLQVVVVYHYHQHCIRGVPAA
jgi:hypothetical protein